MVFVDKKQNIYGHGTSLQNAAFAYLYFTQIKWSSYFLNEKYNTF